MNAVKAQLTKVLKETNATFIQYRCEIVSKRKNWLKRRNRWVRIITLLKVKREIQKLDNNMKHLVASDPDIAKAHKDVTRSKVELGKYKDVLLVSDPKLSRWRSNYPLTIAPTSVCY